MYSFGLFRRWLLLQAAFQRTIPGFQHVAALWLHDSFLLHRVSDIFYISIIVYSIFHGCIYIYMYVCIHFFIYVKGTRGGACVTWLSWSRPTGLCWWVTPASELCISHLLSRYGVHVMQFLLWKILYSENIVYKNKYYSVFWKILFIKWNIKFYLNFYE